MGRYGMYVELRWAQGAGTCARRYWSIWPSDGGMMWVRTGGATSAIVRSGHRPSYILSPCPRGRRLDGSGCAGGERLGQSVLGLFRPQAVPFCATAHTIRSTVPTEREKQVDHALAGLLPIHE